VAAGGPVTVRAATLGAAATAAGLAAAGLAAAAGVAGGPLVAVTLNGRPAGGDGEVPLAAGDVIVFSDSAGSQRSPS
jgi:hypothetical protein